MKNIKTLSLLLLVLSFATTAFKCHRGSPTPDPDRGFKVLAGYRINGNFVVQCGVVNGQFLRPNGTTTGTLESFSRVDTCGNGNPDAEQIRGARVPGRWNLSAFVSGCPEIARTEEDVDPNEIVRLICPSDFRTFTFTPDTINIQAPPPTSTIVGNGFSTTYGMPTISYYSDYGYLVAQTTASEVAPDGTWLKGATPDLSGAYSGLYAVVITNATADGNGEILGSANISLYGNDPPPPDPPSDPCTTPQQPEYDNGPEMVQQPCY